jgi:two-component system nitrogen regulation sensor histidine kinase NtrY
MSDSKDNTNNSQKRFYDVRHNSRLKLPLFYEAFKRSGWERKLAFILGIAAIVSGFATYGALKDMPPFGNDPQTVFWLLNLDLMILLLLVSLISWRIVALWSGRKKGTAGSRLHVRLVFIFSVLAATPAIIMTLFSAYFFHYGIQTWFSERVSTAVNEAQAVAEAYLEEHQQVIRADILAMANDLDRQASILIGNEIAFNRLMRTQSVLRNFSEAIVFDSTGRIIAESGLTFTLEFESVPEHAMKQAQDGDVVLMTAGNEDKIRALVKLNNFADSYLFVGRMVDPVVLSHLYDTRRAAEEYEQLQVRYSDMQFTAMMIFIVVALVLLLSAVWFGLVLARQLVAPIGTLVAVSDRVRGGDLTARVPENEGYDEFEYLARSFNRMTSQIQSQQDELIGANRKLDYRRRFTETILAGVSSGVVGVNEHGRITMVNSMLSEILQIDATQLTGRNIAEILPDIAGLLKEAHSKPSRITQSEMPYHTKEGGNRTLLVRIAIELIGEEDKGAVLTFDDITELQSAQRKAAWADVARRIAHEIKNPLTPIQLSAERLKRKYIDAVGDDKETFARLTDTIIRHVNDIGLMVNEFSAFARMPEPVMKEENILSHIRDTLLLHQHAHPEIKFAITGPGSEQQEIPLSCDAQQFRQALTNLLQNAVDSVLSTPEKEDEYAGKIAVFVANWKDNLVIAVSDNGPGFPEEEEKSRLTEPYVTMKEKGTGLGLAIVKKIMEDHRGKIIIGAPEWLTGMPEWRDMGGATVVISVPHEQIDDLSEKTRSAA